MKPAGPKTVIQAIAEHPWSSLRDFAVLSAIMIFAVLMAQHYDIFGFIESLAYPSREISPAEAVMLGGIGAACVWTFISRRLREAGSDAAGADILASEMHALRVLAMQDPLTSLPNRRVLLDALDMATKLPPMEGRSHAVFLLDLNGFKGVNDRYGHAVGDEVLKAVVARFRHAARRNDVFARLGGDEFAVLSRDVDEIDARAIGDRFIGALGHSVRAGGATHAIGVAIGAALFPEDGDTVEKIMRHADVAMYRAKSNEGSSLVFFRSVAAEGGIVRKATA
ncbi:MAG: GGDEF domain-containing protein [Hyphomicrobium sp.]|uniref:GGDEF domain-containing protein n=1 Tax=Hyphomicrobium sp. TaxID=82 RepID=UPI0013260391|nr:GGDEF domain-containing protein [Hyphomicrobium sp.]KAB2938952.1 MAG: GGDEF domain-containing protein [Hyphomicrobium sp.]MBZ0208739.1 GGDEF domain-containing protein [Hyphomicrobium sp.]MCZ7596243.1 GGDEF domain-containing protein [Hyphomicrobium sp.]